MQEQRRQRDVCRKVEPENRPVECIELAGVIEDVENKGSQANVVKVQRLWGARAPDQNENSNKEIQDPDDFQIRPLQRGALRRRRHKNGSLKRGYQQETV